VDRVLDYDFHPPVDLRVFTYTQQSVLRFDNTALIVEADYGGTLLRHYAFPDRWFKINTTDTAGQFRRGASGSEADPLVLQLRYCNANGC
jgi:hypothetical protein